MNTRQSVLPLKRWFSNVDWKLLIFLVLVFNVKLVVKFVAIAIFLLLRKNFKFGFRVKNSRLPLFYPCIIVIAAINLVPNCNQPNYLPAFATGILFWLAMIAGVHLVKSFVETNNFEGIEKTLSVFFVVNALISFGMLFYIIIDSGSINPYTYQGEFQKYFISTGDYIKGISFDTSTTNAVMNAFGALFFFTRNKFSLFFICFLTLLLTGSNMVNFVFAACLLFLFIFRSVRVQKSVIIVSMLMLVVFLLKISPQNNQYVTSSVAHFTGKDKTPLVKTIATAVPDAETIRIEKAKSYLDSMNRVLQAAVAEPAEVKVTDAAVKWEEKPEIPTANIHSAAYQFKEDTSSIKELKQFAVSLPSTPGIDSTKRLPGKLLALRQTLDYFYEHPATVLTGTGMGNFSSKLAFKTTGLNIAGGYPDRFIHIDSAFKHNHLALHLSFFADRAGYHSIINSPNSVYDQMISEYGLAGLLALGFLYIGFFLKHLRSLTYGLPLLMMLTGLFFLDYWFEQLSIIFLFELLLFLDIKTGKR